MPRDLRNVNAARKALADPATSGDDLATIAERHPDLAAQVAAHPNIYPELREWLRTTHPSAFAASAAASASLLSDFASESSQTPAPRPETETWRDNRIWVGLLIGIAAGGLAFGAYAVWSTSRGGEEGAQTATSDGAAPTSTTGDDPDGTPTPSASPTPTEEPSPAPQPTTTSADPTPTPSMTEPGINPVPAELSAEHCGTVGRLSILAETERFQAAICLGDSGFTYVGRSKETGDGIQLPAYVPANPPDDLGAVNYMAENGDITYRLTDSFLFVYDGNTIIVQEPIASWQEWHS